MMMGFRDNGVRRMLPQKIPLLLVDEEEEEGAFLFLLPVGTRNEHVCVPPRQARNYSE